MTEPERDSQMNLIPFGNTSLRVSQLCLGTMSMGSSAWKSWVLDEPASVPILRRALVFHRS
jgi:1-deoxyxylulose-5-phosphate synthase